MNWFDYTIVGIILVSALISVVRGFVKEALSLVSWLIALWVALTFATELSTLLQSYIDQEQLRLAVSFVILFVATLFVGAMVNLLISRFMKASGLSGTDRVLGLFFGTARGALVVSLLTLVIGMSALEKNDWWQASVLVPYTKPLAQWLQTILQAEPDATEVK